VHRLLPEGFKSTFSLEIEALAQRWLALAADEEASTDLLREWATGLRKTPPHRPLGHLAELLCMQFQQNNGRRKALTPTKVTQSKRIQA